MTRTPIACTLSAQDRLERRQTMLSGLTARSTSRSTLPDGFRWGFVPSSELLTDMVAVIDAERQCCPFLQFEVTVEANGGPVWLDVTGREGVAEFLEQLVTEE